MGGWWAFRPDAQLVGSTASVLHYNVFSRNLISIFSRIFLVPCVAYFDDFGWYPNGGFGSGYLLILFVYGAYWGSA